jgi:hypothetical protein
MIIIIFSTNIKSWIKLMSYSAYLNEFAKTILSKIIQDLGNIYKKNYLSISQI